MAVSDNMKEEGEEERLDGEAEKKISVSEDAVF